MIVGIGIDLIEVDRIKKEIAHDTDRFVSRIFTENEIAYCSKGANPSNRARCFSARFAAKEAFFKAVGTGLRDGLAWLDVEVRNDDLGKPHLELKNRAGEIIKNGNISKVHLSISHGRDYATAVVILEKTDE